MRHIGLLAGAPVLLALAAGCSVNFHNPTAPATAIVGSGRFVTESRPVQAAGRIVASGALRVTVVHTGVGSLDVTAEDNILPLVSTVESNGTLVLGLMPGAGGISSHGVEIRVGVRQLRAVDASGACRIGVDAITTGDAFSVTLSGASQLTAAGAVDSLTLDVTGASRIDAPGLAGRTVTGRLSGASGVVLRIVDLLRATVSGASTLEYFGDPVVEASVSGGSIVRRIGP